jgi:polysaccharide biosynthesis/export protein
MGDMIEPEGPRINLRRWGRAITSSALLFAMLFAGARGGRTQEVGTSAPEVKTAVAIQTNDTRDDRYRIGPGDILDIRIFNRPQLSREAVRVDMRGMIRMPLIDDEVRAACLTESTLAQAIATAYLKYQRHPHVDVFIKEYNSKPVAALGAVAKPGQFQLQRRVRLLELLSLAGGPTEHAGARILVAHSNEISSCDAETYEPVTGFSFYNLNDTIKGDEKSNPYLRPGDIITVPEAEQVFVVGNVFKPSSIPLKEPVSVSQAIAMAGGMLPDSKHERVRIFRQTPGSPTKTEMLVDLKAIEKRQAEDITLRANDVVEVPSSTRKRVLHSLLNAIAPTASLLPLRVVR